MKDNLGPEDLLSPSGLIMLPGTWDPSMPDAKATTPDVTARQGHLAISGTE